MEGNNLVQSNHDGDPDSAEGCSKIESALDKNEIVPILTNSLDFSDQSPLASNFKLIILLRNENVNPGSCDPESKSLAPHIADDISLKYVTFNAGKTVKDQTQIIHEDNVDAWFGKKLKIILERVDEVLGENYRFGWRDQFEANLDTFCAYQSHRGIAGSASESLRDDSSDGEMERGNTLPLSISIKVENDWDETGAMLDGFSGSSTSLPTVQENSMVSDIRKNWNSSRLSHLEITRRFIDVPTTSETSLRCEDTIEKSSGIKGEILHKSTNKIPPVDVYLPYICRPCPARFKKMKYTKHHVMTQSKETPLSCEESTVPEHEFKNGKNHSKKNYVRRNACHLCPAKFCWRGSLIRHLKTHTNPTPFTCPECGLKFPGQISLNRHSMIHKGGKLHCDVCDRTNCKHIRSQHLTMPLVCAFCNEKFPGRAALKTHMITHVVKKNYTCPFCRAKFSDKTNHDNHVRTHLDQKFYACIYCTAKFTRKTQLNEHLKTHSEERPFGCNHCDSQFSTLYTLNKHIRIMHTDFSPLACTLCNVSFARRIELDEHFKTHVTELKPI